MDDEIDDFRTLTGIMHELKMKKNYQIKILFKLDGPKQFDSERSAKLDGPGIQMWTVFSAQAGRSLDVKVDGPIG